MPSSVLPFAGEVVDADVAFLAGSAARDHELAVGEERHAHRRARRRVWMRFTSLPVSIVPDGQFVVAADDEVLAVRREREGVDDGREGVDLRRRRRLPAEAKFLGDVGLRRRGPPSSLAPSVIHCAMTAALSFGTASPLSRGGMRRLSVVTMRSWNSLSSGLPAMIGSPFGAAGHELLVGGHVVLARLLLRVVAGEAVFLEDRGHVVDEADRPVLGGGGLRADRT